MVEMASGMGVSSADWKIKNGKIVKPRSRIPTPESSISSWRT